MNEEQYKTLLESHVSIMETQLVQGKSITLTNDTLKTILELLLDIKSKLNEK